MDWMALVKDIFELCLIPLLGILVKYIVSYLNAKQSEMIDKSEANADNKKEQLINKYLAMAMDTVKDCVIATNQTYVESLKQQGKFDVEAQKEAFNKTLTAVLGILTTEAKDYISSAVGDLEIYLGTLIEAQVNQNK